MKQKMVANIRYIKSNYLLYLLVAPAVILTIIFKYVPIYGLLIAFKDYNPLNGIMGSEWVGLEHFTRFMSSPNFSILLINTLKLSVYGLLLGFFPPIILALSFNLLASDKLKKRLQLILYAPNFISVVVIAGMLFLFFANKGPINNIFESLTGKTLPFLTGPKYFRPLYIFSGIWQGIGWSSILYTATLANVPPELIEASEIDGANILQRIWHIDLPALKPVMTISFILAAGSIMSIGYEKAYLLQTTMNLPSSEIIATYVYKVGLQSGDYSYSTAVGLFNSVINLILLVSVNQVVKKLNDGEGL
ncbi:ABC transporter permease [Lactococcus lactis]|uniref:ABC transporter permease n=1 Tax=Lactococcus lactis TaxID=1358 RepID=UPI001C1F2B62|nr:ABC transporter permease subunit [Lactococcus lactis]MBU7543108.1 sugar ABC transporter permease [Lactococcus lactis]WKG36253.1 ABC transporter permease subunit [Lactococcus lactis subsp. lactis]